MGEEEKISKKKRSVISMLFNYVVYGFVILLILCLALTLLFQIPSFQNWAVDKVANRISKKIDGNVSIGRINLAFQDGLVLEDFLITGAEGDTIFTSGQVSSAFNNSVFGMIQEGIDLDDFVWKDGKLNLHRNSDEQMYNLEKLLQDVLNNKEDTDPKSKKTSIKVGAISLQNIEINIDDERNNKSQYFYIKEGYIDFETFDLEDLHFDIKSVELDEPIVDLTSQKNSKSSIQNAPVDTSINVSLPDSNLFDIKIQALIVKNGKLKSQRGGKSNGNFDAEDIDVRDIELLASDIFLKQDSSYSGSLSNLSASLNNSLEVKSSSVTKVTYANNGLMLEDFNFKTDQSSIVHTDFRINNLDQIESATIIAELDDANLSLTELLYFFPKLKDSEFVTRNQENIIHLSGRLKGRPDNLLGQDISLAIGTSTFFRGNIRGRNLLDSEGELINLKVENLTSDMASLRAIIPGFNPPLNFNKLGAIQFKGNIDGYFNDFVTYGVVQTQLGNGSLDIKLDTKEGIEDAKYSGSLALDDFDLKTWSENDDFGSISFNAQINDGIGLTLDKADVSLEGAITDFDYKDYVYHDINIEGSLSENLFNGRLSLEDENADLDFDGIVNLSDSIPDYQFGADIRKIDFHALNLMDKPFVLTTNVDLDMNGKDLRNIEGTANNYGLVIMTNDTIYTIDSLMIRSTRLGGEAMKFELESHLATAKLEGVFDLQQVPNTLIRILKENYPYHTRNLGFDNTVTSEIHQNFTFDMDINDTENLLELAGINGLRVEKTKLKGEINNEEDRFDVKINSPLFKYKDYSFLNLEARAVSFKQFGSFYAYADSSYMYNDSTHTDARVFDPITLATSFSGDTVDFDIATTDIIDSLGRFELSGQLIPHEQGYQVNLENDKWNMLGDTWVFDRNNKVVFGPNYIDIEHFEMKDSIRSIMISDIENKGLDVQFKQFDIDLLNPIIDYDKMLLSGRGDVHVQLKNIFNSVEVEADVLVPRFAVNDDDFGRLTLDVNQNSKDVLGFDLNIKKDHQYLNTNGTFDTKKLYLDSDLNINEYPLSIFEYIIEDGIDRTQGTATIDLAVFGDLSDLKMRGDGTLNNGGTRVIYLGTYYEFDNQKVSISEKYVDLSQLEITDTKGNVGSVSGGLRHDFLTDFRLDLAMYSENFIVLETTKEDNPLYYGHGEGEIDVTFSGGFDFADIRVNAVTGEDSKVTFPISTTQTGAEESFIKFTQKSSNIFETNFTEDFQLTGLDFEMTLDITEEAELEMIFDETVGDILKGTGRGAVQVFIKRTGEFDVFGEFEIEEGEYLFTAYGFVAKPFLIDRGGIITWSGDPFDANLDIRAKYQNLRAPLNLFLEEYLLTPAQKDGEARNQTDIDLTMLLGGTLYTPEVNFDIGFPQVTGELKSYTESKMRALRATENGINNQVVGLLVFRNFLPYNNPLANLSGGNLGATAFNTVSEFFSSQLSLLVSEIIQQQLKEDFFIEGIDIDIGFTQNTDFYNVDPQTAGLIPDVVDLNIRNRFKNNAFVLNLGGNYVRNSNAGQNNDYFLTDIVLEWYLTEDRRLKFNIYNRGDYNQIGDERKWRSGFGIRYRTEFGSISDFKQELEEALGQDSSL